MSQRQALSQLRRPQEISALKAARQAGSPLWKQVSKQPHCCGPEQPATQVNCAPHCDTTPIMLACASAQFAITQAWTPSSRCS
jgi:hypothetical protein